VREEFVEVTVPASSANLGPGFDCLALALELRNRLAVRPSLDGATRVWVEGEGAGWAPDDRDNLVVRAFEAAGGSADGLEFHMRNAIPFGRGLGSSAAAITAGIAAAQAVGAGPSHDPLALAVDLEGHPDNVAAALLGGITVAWTAADGPRAIRLSDGALDGLAFVAVVPVQRLATRVAREALPADVAHADAAFTAARAALLVAALEGGRRDALREALADRLHEPYRAPLAPLLAVVRARVGGTPAFGATLSGAGPGVLVWCERGDEDAVVRVMDGVDGARARPLAPAGAGVVVS
jgi:homoserine kinase